MTIVAILEILQDYAFMIKLSLSSCYYCYSYHSFTNSVSLNFHDQVPCK